MQAKKYHSVSKFLHWFIAFFIIAMLIVGFFLEDIPSDWQGLAYTGHKSIGITLLFLMIFRFFWVLRTGKPALPKTTPFWENALARSVQYALYVDVVAMVLIGWIMSTAAGYIPDYFGIYPWAFPGIEPNEPLAETLAIAHEYGAWILIGLLVLHTAGALKHHIIDKDDVLRSMLPEKQKTKPKGKVK